MSKTDGERLRPRLPDLLEPDAAVRVVEQVQEAFGGAVRAHPQRVGRGEVGAQEQAQAASSGPSSRSAVMVVSRPATRAAVRSASTSCRRLTALATRK